MVTVWDTFQEKVVVRDEGKLWASVITAQYVKDKVLLQPWVRFVGGLVDVLVDLLMCWSVCWLICQVGGLLRQQCSLLKMMFHYSPAFDLW